MSNPIYEINHQDVAHEIIDGEAILINMSTGRYYSLDGSGATIWEILQQGGISPATLAQILRTRYTAEESQISVEVTRMLEQMLGEGLLVSALEEISRTESTSQADRPPFATPILQKYTDLEALLLLDPIHDVSSEGWPKRKPDEN